MNNILGNVREKLEHLYPTDCSCECIDFLYSAGSSFLDLAVL